MQSSGGFVSGGISYMALWSAARYYVYQTLMHWFHQRHPIVMWLYTSSVVHHFNDYRGLSPYITERGRFGDSSWQRGRAWDRTRGSAGLPLDDEAVVARFIAARSPSRASAVTQCFVYRLHGRQQWCNVLLPDIKNHARGWRGRRVQLAHMLFFHRLLLSHINAHKPWVTEVRAGLSLQSCLSLSPQAVVPASCMEVQLLEKKKNWNVGSIKGHKLSKEEEDEKDTVDGGNAPWCLAATRQ